MSLEKKTIILIDNVELNEVNPDLLRNARRIAFNPSAMLAFEEHGLSSESIEDIYPCAQFRIDHDIFMTDLEGLLADLDAVYAPLVNYPRAFSGHFYWFLVFLMEFFYISKLAHIMGKDEHQFTIVGGARYQYDFKVDHISIDDDPKLLKNVLGLRNKSGMLKQALSANYIVAKSKLTTGRDVRQILKSVKRNLIMSKNKYFNAFQEGKGEKFSDVGKNIFVIQDGYDVQHMSRNMPEYTFINPLTTVLTQLEKVSKKSEPIKHVYAERLKMFTDKYCPEFNNIISRYFKSFHLDLVERIPLNNTLVEELFDRLKPAAVLFSIGAKTVFEDSFGHYANLKNVPVFYFQHGGAITFYHAPYAKYAVRNKNIKHYAILQSIEEQKELDGGYLNTKVLGSVTLNRTYVQHQKTDFSKNSKILYATSPFSAYSSKELTTHTSDQNLFYIHKDLKSCVDKYSLNFDIKLHPVDQEQNAAYFSALFDVPNQSNVRVINHGTVEKMIQNYGLMVLDYTGSFLIPYSFVVDIPIILYVNDLYAVNKRNIADMNKRFYVVQNADELDHCIQEYKSGRLQSKWSEDLMSRYVFPVDQGDPAQSIAEYIREIIVHHQAQQGSITEVALK